MADQEWMDRSVKGKDTGHLGYWEARALGGKGTEGAGRQGPWEARALGGKGTNYRPPRLLAWTAEYAWTGLDSRR